MGVLIAALDFSCNFFLIPTSGLEQCVHISSTFALGRSIIRVIYVSAVRWLRICVIFRPGTKYVTPLNKSNLGLTLNPHSTLISQKGMIKTLLALACFAGTAYASSCPALSWDSQWGNGANARLQFQSPGSLRGNLCVITLIISVSEILIFFYFSSKNLRHTDFAELQSEAISRWCWRPEVFIFPCQILNY